MPTTTRIRAFRWDEVEELTLLCNEVNGLTGTPKAYDVELMRQMLSLPNCRPERNCFVAESRDTLVGYALVAPELPIDRAVVSGGILPAHRKQGIGRGLLKRAVEHANGLKAAVVQVAAPGASAGIVHLLESEGFRYIKEYWQMRWDSGEIPTGEGPGRFETRAFVTGQDEELLTELQNAAFRGSWGFCPNTVDEISATVQLKRSDPEGIILLYDEDRPSAYAWTMSASTDVGSIGWIAMAGVHPDYRGRRLGRAVVAAGMAYLKSKGINAIELEVDSENPAGRRLYLGLGFERVGDILWYEKRLKA